ncbi:MAG: transglutaminase domain-containing protein [Firmicutes bacterium]|nr:transglutaminase domain-containing protein [Bacillota bacterium]
MKMNYILDHEDLQYQCVPLPEDILKMKWSGRLDLAKAMIENRLSLPDLPKAYRARLTLELKNIGHLKLNYTKTKDEVLAEIQQRIPDFTMDEVDQCILEGRLEWIFIDGQEMFMGNTVHNLFSQYPDIWGRTKEGDTRTYKVLHELMDCLPPSGSDMKAHIHIRHDLQLSDEMVEEGKMLHVYLPVPLQRQQITNLKVHSISPKPRRMPQEGDIQPAAYIETPAKKGQVFSVEYEFDNVTRYVDLSQADFDAVAEAAAAGYPEDTLSYLEERGPHIVFTPYLRSLAAELIGEETNPLKIARIFYDYITCKLKYSFVRDYASLDSIAEHMAVNRKGDCGVQAILFVTLCRLAGIPARWQSGLDAEPNDIGEHDWAQFYVPSIGWVYCDPSFGMSCHLRNKDDLWNFYFGNLDPYRIPLNCDMQYDFVPPKKFIRFDPTDNQCGEIEYDDGGIYSGKSRTFTDLGIRLIKEEK